jgi:hypothetical protein
VSADVIEFPYHAQEIAKSLRALADQVDSGIYDPARLLVVMEMRMGDGGGIELFGYGAPHGYTNAHAAGVLYMAQLRALGVI